MMRQRVIASSKAKLKVTSTALKMTGTALSLTFLAACGDTTPIVVSPADMLSISVQNTQGGPVVGANISYEKMKFKINTPIATPPIPYTLPGDFEEASSMQTTDTSGKTAFFLPRHGSVNTQDVMVVNQSWGNMYSFVLTPQITIDLVTTVFYEMLAYSTVSPSSFTVQQLISLQAHAYRSINTAIANFWLNPNTSMAKLHRAYQNALAADISFITELQQTSMANGFLLAGYVPYQNNNTQTSIVASAPRQFNPVVIETNQLDFSVSAFDADHDTIFYNWVVLPFDPLSVPNVLTQLYRGQLLFSEVGGNTTSNFKMTSDYNTVPWYQGGGTVSVFLAAVVSDGFTPRILQYWNMSVQNKERLPVFTTTPSLLATEDSPWTYTPAATSPDGAPIKLSLVSPVVGMDMCVPNKYYMANPPANLPALATLQTWSWQIALTPCSTPNQIVWTPNNCESGPVFSPQGVTISAVDYTGTGTTQGFLVTVTDVNTAPIITSTPGSLSITGPTAWTYTPTFLDPQSTVADPTHIGPGGRVCGDVFVYTMPTFPVGATIDPVTGLVSWTPTGTEVGVNPFKIQLDDRHGGIITQSWNVTVVDMNDTPVITTSCPTTAHMATLDAFGFSHYNCGVTVSQWNINSLFKMTITGGPAGMSPAPAFGVFVPPGLINGFSWTPTDANTPNSWPITIQVCNDGEAGVFAPKCSAVFSYTLNAPKEDLLPKITSTAPITVLSGCLQADCATVGASHMTYTATVTDGNVSPADTFTFSAVQPNPSTGAAMTVTPVSSTAPNGSVTLDWSVSNLTDLGPHVISVKATSGLVANGGPHSDTQSWSIFVQETNRFPTFAAIPAQTGQNGIPYTYNFQPACSTNAITSPNKTLTFSLGAGSPTGMKINAKTGILTWLPTSAQAKASQPLNYSVNCLSAQGSPATSVTVAVPVALTWVNQAPVWTHVPNQIIGVGQTFVLPLSATDPDGDVVTMSATGAPVGSIFSHTGGSGSFTWTPTAGNIGMSTVTFRASDGTLITPMPVQFQVVNTPIVLSHPVTVAMANYPYHYELHALDPAGGGLTYSFSVDTPSGIQVTPGTPTTSAMVTWTPSLGAVGPMHITLSLTDVNAARTDHIWTINVTSGGSGSQPLLLGTTVPAGIVGAPTIATEGSAIPIHMFASDPDGNQLHYAYYWDHQWIADQGTEPSYTPDIFTPGPSDSGDHILTLALNNGESADLTQDVPVHVRDAIPILGQTFSAGGLTALLTNSRTNQLYATVGGGSPALLVFDETTMQATGPVQNVALGITPHRIAMNNNVTPSPNDYSLYFAQLGDLLAAGNSYAGYDYTSAVGTYGACSVAACFRNTFGKGNAFAGGSQTAMASNTNAYYVKSSNRRYLGTYMGGVAGADIDLGVGAIGNAVVYDSFHSKIYVASGGTNQITVINPTTNMVTTQINFATLGMHNPALLTLNGAAGKLYAYSPTDGSIAEIFTASDSLSFSLAGFPTSASIGPDSPTLMVENTDDDVIYLGNPELGELVVYDITNSGLHSLSLGSAPSELSFDISSHTLVGGIFSSGLLFQER